MTIGEKIQYYRKQQNMSQEQLGALLYVSRQTVSLWEKDQTVPTVENLIRLREIFGTSVDDLLSVAYEGGTAPKVQPLEQYTFAYTEEDIRQLNRLRFKKRFTKLFAIWILCICLIPIQLLSGGLLIAGFNIGLLSVMTFLLLYELYADKKKRAQRIRYYRENNVAAVFALYEDHLDIADYSGGEMTSYHHLRFSDIERFTDLGDFLLIEHGSVSHIVKKNALPQNSRLYLFLRTNVMEAQVDHAPKWCRVLSVMLCVLSVLSFFAAFTVIIYMEDAAGVTYRYDWIMLPFAVIPLSCLLYSVYMKKKGYHYRKNLFVGFGMLLMHLVFSIAAFIP